MTDETKKAPWWNDRIAASWEKAKATAVAEWAKVTADTKKLEKVVVERALAFGHGARKAYEKVEVWTDQVERDLGEQWQRLGNEGAAAWAKVRDTVKHEWQRATEKQAAGAEPPAPAAAGAEPQEPPAAGAEPPPPPASDRADPADPDKPQR
jgi:hypothetical protein